MKITFIALSVLFGLGLLYLLHQSDTKQFELEYFRYKGYSDRYNQILPLEDKLYVTFSKNHLKIVNDNDEIWIDERIDSLHIKEGGRWNTDKWRQYRIYSTTLSYQDGFFNVYIEIAEEFVNIHDPDDKSRVYTFAYELWYEDVMAERREFFTKETAFPHF